MKAIAFMFSIFFSTHVTSVYSDTQVSTDKSANMERYVSFVNELSERRNVNRLFPNIKSSTHGIQIDYVNTSTGSLTFAKRDLVTLGRMPIVITRLYDSSNAIGSFGNGWGLSYDEKVSTSNDTLTYIDETGSKYSMYTNGSHPFIGNRLDVSSYSIETDSITIFFKSGWKKIFETYNGEFRLKYVYNAYDENLEFHYDATALNKITNGIRTVFLERNSLGLITRVRDDLDQVVEYNYSDGYLLSNFTQQNQSTWHYKYSSLKLLREMIDPNHNAPLEVKWNDDLEVKSINIKGVASRFSYNENLIDVSKGANNFIHIEKYEDGTTKSTTNNDGLYTEIRYDSRKRPIMLYSGFYDEHFSFSQLFEDSRFLSTELENITGGKTVLVFMSYDSSNNLSGISELKNGNFHYTDIKQETSQSTTITSSGDVFVTRFNHANKIESIELNGQIYLSHRYDSNGDLLEIKNNNGNIQFTHNNLGLVESVTINNSTPTIISYNEFGAPSSIDYSNGTSVSYIYDNNNIRSQSHWSNGLKQSYGYDSSGNLTNVETYDSNDNLIDYRYFNIDEHNRINSINTNDNITLLGYDFEGNLTAVELNRPVFIGDSFI